MEHSPIRWVLAGALLAGLAAATAWLLFPRPEPPLVAAAPAAVDVDPTPAANLAGPDPEPLPSPTEDPRLEELRATDAFDEFAEHPRAMQADAAAFAWGNFRPFVGGAPGEWSNKAELWDALVPKIRDEALLLGPQYPHPVWGARDALPSALEMRWSNEKTGGRGQFVEFWATYTGSDNEPVDRYWAALIVTGEDGSGRVVAEMEPFDLEVGAFPDIHAQREELRPRLWQWVLTQPVRS